ncbi:MAG: hypothetical protein ACXVGR_15295 [Mycobacteriaceae bacterium]
MTLYAADDRSELVGARQGRPNFLGQSPMGGVHAHRKRCPEPPQCALDHEVIAIRGKQDADSRASIKPGAIQSVRPTNSTPSALACANNRCTNSW